jgi:spore germination protein GerM
MRRILIWLVVLLVAGAALWLVRLRPQETKVEVYFVREADGAATVMPVERVVAGRGAEALLRAALEALLAGPSAQEQARGLSTEVPEGTRLRGVAVREGVAVVDLSEAVGSGGGSSSMQGRLWQIVYTGTQLPQAQQVRIIIEGEERQALGGEGLLIDRPIARPPAFPKF